MITIYLCFNYPIESWLGCTLVTFVSTSENITHLNANP